MFNEEERQFIESLKKGPSILFLGQSAYKKLGNYDPILKLLSKKYNSNTSQELINYNDLLNLNLTEHEAVFSWLNARCRGITPTENLEYIANYPWNAVYTSLIDSNLIELFQSDLREVQPITNSDYIPLNPRDRQRLNLTYMFGCTNQVDMHERPPLNIFELSSKEYSTSVLTGRLPELVTSLGTLVIEGYEENDWLDVKHLHRIISQLNIGQTYIFNVSESLRQNAFIENLVLAKKVILIEKSLATCLTLAHNEGLINFNYMMDISDERVLRLEENFISVPKEIWNQISKSAIVLDESTVVTPKPISKDKAYFKFREFLSSTNTRPMWEGYAHGFAFKRNFEQGLLEEIHYKLASKEINENPIILHGQTGTGKTVSLGRIAFEIKKKGKYPVLFIERKVKKPSYEDISNFCYWAEERGAKAILIIWDGMVDTEGYFEMTRYLGSRGRKTLVIGSSYKLKTNNKNKSKENSNLLEVSSLLQEEEMIRLKRLIKDFDPNYSKNIVERLNKSHDNVLVALYRILPDTRYKLRSGIEEEITFSEKRLRLSMDKQKELKVTLNSFQQQLLKFSGGTELDFADENKTELFGGEEVNKLQKMIYMIMTPGRFGQNIPIELLMRVVGQSEIMNIIEIIKNIDLFRYYEDNSGNIFVGPRHPLEAKLCLENRYGGVEFEVEMVKSILIKIKDSSMYLENIEIEFAVELLKNIGPNSNEKARFKKFYKSIAETLKELRENYGVNNSRIMLQEATFRREWLRHMYFSKECEVVIDKVELYKQIEYSEALLKEALELAEEYNNLRLKNIILAELASTLGYKLTHLIEENEKPTDILKLYSIIKEQVMRARVLDQTSYHALDVLLWTTRDVLQKVPLEIEGRIEIEAYLQYVLENVNENDFDYQQKDNFFNRKDELAKVIKDEEMSQEAVRKLHEIESTAYYYLKARKIVKDFNLSKDVHHQFTKKAVCEAILYLQENYHKINKDAKCVHLLLKLWWYEKSGTIFFINERQTIPFDAEEWRYCLKLIDDLLNAEELQNELSIRLLKAVALFHIGGYQESIQELKVIENEAESMFSRLRIMKSFLASTSAGKPQVYSGRVRSISPDRKKGWLFIDDIMKSVFFIPIEFNRSDLRIGDSLECHIAFNFRGLMGEPKSRYHRDRGGN